MRKLIAVVIFVLFLSVFFFIVRVRLFLQFNGESKINKTQFTTNTVLRVFSSYTTHLRANRIWQNISSITSAIRYISYW